MKELAKDSERTWYEVARWKTDAGLYAVIRRCEWSDRVKVYAPSIHDFCTGYVMAPEGYTPNQLAEENLDVHGGVTFNGKFDGEDGYWIGFDQSHYGDENISDQDGNARSECEKLAAQIVMLPADNPTL